MIDCSRTAELKKGKMKSLSIAASRSLEEIQTWLFIITCERKEMSHRKSMAQLKNLVKSNTL